MAEQDTHQRGIHVSLIVAILAAALKFLEIKYINRLPAKQLPPFCPWIVESLGAA